MNAKKLLQQRINEFPLNLNKSWVAKHIKQLYRELENKGISFRPHIWISDDWYSPDGVAGFAIPFYLLNEELIRLEKKMIGEAEGETSDWLMMLLRHETAHALDNAFHLRKRKKRQQLFGKTSVEYPESYEPIPYDKNYVVHLDAHYAQAHPDEDWAETFSVWLNPKSHWKNVYENWPALKKLELCDEIMNSIKGKKPLNNKIKETEGLETLNYTLEEYYQEKRKRLGLDKKERFSKELMNTFQINKGKHSLKNIIKQNKHEFIKRISKRVNKREDLIEKYIDDLAQESKIYLKNWDDDIKIELVEKLTSQSKKYFRMGIHKVYM